MKFAYIDESGDRSEGDTFVMAGLLLDAYRLRKTTENFDRLLESLFNRHPGSPRELKTKAFMRGNGGWSAIPGNERQQFLSDVCTLAVDNGNKIAAFALSFSSFDASVKSQPQEAAWAKSYWVSSALLLCAVIQKKMQAVKGRKGLTAVVMDENRKEMPALSESLHRAPEWYDELYATRERHRGQMRWTPRTPNDRFDQIINTGFCVNSEHSSLMQVADAISWTYRRSLDVEGREEWQGEAAFYKALRERLDAHRQFLGICPPSRAVAFYDSVKHPLWTC
jgi:hypothetical protein